MHMWWGRFKSWWLGMRNCWVWWEERGFINNCSVLLEFEDHLFFWGGTSSHERAPPLLSRVSSTVLSILKYLFSRKWDSAFQEGATYTHLGLPWLACKKELTRMPNTMLPCVVFFFFSKLNLARKPYFCLSMPVPSQRFSQPSTVIGSCFQRPSAARFALLEY